MNRLPSQPTPAFGLVAWLEETKISLPLKGVECRFEVTAGLASVEMDQIFHQNAARPLDCKYTFPLPAGAAVYRCEMHVNGRVVRATVEADADAKRIYREQKAAGHRAALVEVERENLFTLSLGNVQPDDVIVIRFAWFQTLERIADELSLRIPVCPGIRYIPGKPLLRSLSGRGVSDDTDEVPDASRISPPRIDALHPDAAYFTIAGRLAASEVAADSLSSPTHLVALQNGDDFLQIALAENGAVPDRDFVLRWTEAKEVALSPRAWSYRAGGETFALVQFRAPADAPVATNLPQDVYFLVDRSGSMEGVKWVKTCEALTAFVALLGAEDRVWITLFESHFQDFAEKPLPVAQLQRDPAFRDLVARGVAGGTDLLPAAKHLLASIEQHSTGRRSVVILITDGQVGNDRKIVGHFRVQQHTTVFTFGIDTVVNDAFLRDLAQQTGGECWLQTPNDDIAGTVAKLADRLRRPVLVNLRAAAGWEAPLARLPDLYGGQSIDLCFCRKESRSRTLKITGELSNGEERVFSLPLVAVENPAIRLLWTRERVAALLRAGQSAEAIGLAKAGNILCEGAAFVAWDEAEQVQIAAEEIYQPSFAGHEFHLDDLLSHSFRIGGGHEMMMMRAAAPIDFEDERDESALLDRLNQKYGFTSRELKRYMAPVLALLLVPTKCLSVQKLIDEITTALKVPNAGREELLQVFRKLVEQHLQDDARAYAEAIRLIEKWEAAVAV